jgi:membrane-bound metal-dependent hydrolase YbcI (DUF457 family)
VGPVTNALTSLTLARAGQQRLPRYGTAIMVVAGVAPDLDYLSYFGGAGAFLRLHRAVLHSIPGAVAVACATAGVFWAVDRRRAQREPEAAAKPRLGFLAALFAALAGAGAHVLLDAAGGVGVDLLWPFRAQRYAWNLLTNLDLWVVILLVATLLLPELLRMVSEEIGDRRKRARGRTAAIVALAVFAAYVAARAALHDRAIDLLMSRVYQGRTPLSAGAFPSRLSALEWRGLVITDDTVEEARVPLGPGRGFDPERSVTYYKPQDSPALQAGEAAADTLLYLKYARFPLASLTQLEDGYRFEVRDLQFAGDDLGVENTFVRVDLDNKLQIMRQEILFAAEPGP